LGRRLDSLREAACLKRFEALEIKCCEAPAHAF
jgi:hypothetical protein